MADDMERRLGRIMDTLAQQHSEPDWTQYFESIVSVCPWSRAHWLAGRIDIRTWQDRQAVTALEGESVARMWIVPHGDVRSLVAISNDMNASREGEEWLYSHPQSGHNSTPVPVLIQQSVAALEIARKNNNLEVYKRVPYRSAK